MKLRFSPAGIKYSEFDKVRDQMIPGTAVKLEFEPENKYDSNAVMVHYDGVFVGYVPASLTLSKQIIEERPFLICKVNDYGFEIIEH